MALSKDRIKDLYDDGWSCSDYDDDLCDIDSHGNSRNEFVESDHDRKLSGNALQLHIGETFRPTNEPSQVGKIPGWFNYNVDDYPRSESKPAVRIPPGEFLFFTTEERFRFPFDIDGRLFMNPRVANRGLQFFTLGHIAPGFSGNLTGTLLNMTNDTVYIERSNPILYLVLSETEDPSSHYTHSDPQDTLQKARENVLTHPEPGFALTSEQFITRDEFYRVLAIAVSITIAVVSALNYIGIPNSG